MSVAADTIEKRLKQLQEHLKQENPVLLDAVQGFRDLDRVAQGMGLLARDESFTTQIPWWPLISVLGTFSAGKSTFINHFLGQPLQRTGNQAVDDRFSVICYSQGATGQALPGVALNSDPRFPLYQISKDLETVALGEGERIDAYLQLKVSPSERLRGRILIDSPGFDADAQRDATLRIVDQIIDLSDLVLVFFDARHPEPGAMRDTLMHLVGGTMNRNDSGKFLYILNQIDATAREDNPEDVVAAWQRALGSAWPHRRALLHHLQPRRRQYDRRREQTAALRDQARRGPRRNPPAHGGGGGRACLPDRRDPGQDRQGHPRAHRSHPHRGRRAVAQSHPGPGCRRIRPPDRLLPVLEHRQRALEGALLRTRMAACPQGRPLRTEILIALLAALAVAAHFGIRQLAALTVEPWVRKRAGAEDLRGNLLAAFRANTGKLRSVLFGGVRGWGTSAKRRLETVREECDTYVQTLNDSFTNPSGRPRTLGGDQDPVVKQ